MRKLLWALVVLLMLPVSAQAQNSGPLPSGVSFTKSVPAGAPDSFKGWIKVSAEQSLSIPAEVRPDEIFKEYIVRSGLCATREQCDVRIRLEMFSSIGDHYKNSHIVVRYVIQNREGKRLEGFYWGPFYLQDDFPVRYFRYTSKSWKEITSQAEYRAEQELLEGLRQNVTWYPQ